MSGGMRPNGALRRRFLLNWGLSRNLASDFEREGVELQDQLLLGGPRNRTKYSSPGAAPRLAIFMEPEAPWIFRPKGWGFQWKTRPLHYGGVWGEENPKFKALAHL